MQLYNVSVSYTFIATYMATNAVIIQMSFLQL